jgi:hypothetical protein
MVHDASVHFDYYYLDAAAPERVIENFWVLERMLLRGEKS